MLYKSPIDFYLVINIVVIVVDISGFSRLNNPGRKGSLTHPCSPNPPSTDILVQFARQFRRDFGDIPADLPDFLLASCLLHVADDGLRREHNAK